MNSARQMLDALQAVQSAMAAEHAARSALLQDGTPALQAVWAAARAETDRAWAALWDSGAPVAEGANPGGAAWAREMRVAHEGGRRTGC